MGLESAFCDFFAGENHQAKRYQKIKNKYIFLSSLKTGINLQIFLTIKWFLSFFEKVNFE
jgi:hypothetical protein